MQHGACVAKKLATAAGARQRATASQRCDSVSLGERQHNSSFAGARTESRARVSPAPAPPGPEMTPTPPTAALMQPQPNFAHSRFLAARTDSVLNVIDGAEITTQ